MLGKGKPRTPADSRFQPIVDFYCAESERRYGAYLWDAADGQALGRLLHNQPQQPVEGFKKLLLVAFEWSRGEAFTKGEAFKSKMLRPYCPLLPGFRFTEFARNFVKVVAHSAPLRGQPARIDKEKLRKFMFDLREIEPLIPERARTLWWQEQLYQEFEIGLKEATEILSR